MGTFPPEPRAYHREEYVPDYPDFGGGICLIIGGGPSLNDMDWDEIRSWETKGPGRYTIAVNEACLTLHPHASIGYWVDARWYNWNRNRMHLCKCKRRMTSAHGQSVDIAGATYVQNDNRKDFYSTDRRYVAGRDSGGIAINLAYHCNASALFLIGFDMWDTPAGDETGNFHDKHLLKQEGTPRKSYFIPTHTKMAEHIERHNLDFKVYNCTPNSALDCWPYLKWSRAQ
jgi:hypothetical protein